MTREEAAWLAGFFDGEGSLSPYNGGRNKHYPCWVISIPNTNKDSIDHCKTIAGSGIISLKSDKSRKAHHKPIWQWRVNAQRDIASLCQQMLPYLIIKKGRVSEFLAEWEDIP